MCLSGTDGGGGDWCALGLIYRPRRPNGAAEAEQGRATAISDLLTGVLSMVLFGTELSVQSTAGMTNVLAAVFLYNAQDP